MQRHLLFLTAGAALTGAASAQLRLTELTTINLNTTSNSANPEFIGSNPSCVAWDGSSVWVAGFNGGAAGADAGIVEVSTALTNPTLGASFGRLATPNQRGYTGLDVAGGRLVAAYDPGGSDPEGYTSWNVGAGGAQGWARGGRGSCGIAYDPGFQGGNPALGSGVGYTNFGSGRRSLFDAVTGLDIWNSTNGMIINTAAGTTWRDIDFDEQTGDVYLRAGNYVIRWTRTGDNAVGTSSFLFTPPLPVNNVIGQNVACLSSPFSTYVIYNKRDNAGATQDFFQVVDVVRPDGSLVTVDWGTFAPALGVGLYDFAWHAASNTLAIVDFANRNVHIFQAVDGIGTNYCTANANSTGNAARMGAQGSAVAAANSVTLKGEQLPQNSFAFFLTSQSAGFVANPGGSAGNLCLTGAIGRYVAPGQIKNSGATGMVSLALNLTAHPQPTGAVHVTAGQTWRFQCWYRDVVGGTATSNFTDGLEIGFQ